MSCSGSEVVDVSEKIMAARQKKQRQVKDSWLCGENLRVPDLVWPRLWIRVALKTSETIARRDATFSWTSVSEQWIANWKDIFWITGVNQNARKLLPSYWILNMSIIDLITGFDAILTSRQTRKKLQWLYENLMSNNFRRTAVLKKKKMICIALVCNWFFFFRTAVLRKLYDIRFSYNHCNFLHCSFSHVGNG